MVKLHLTPLGEGMDPRHYLRTQLGYAWTAAVWFLVISGLIGAFSSIRGLIEVFSVTLMGVYSATDPVLEPIVEPWLAKVGRDNGNHLGSNILLYVVLSLLLTLVFAVLRGRAQRAQLQGVAQVRKARSDAEARDGAVAGGAVGGGLAGLIAGGALGLLFLPALPALLVAGGLAGGAAGASAADDAALIAQARQPGLDPATQKKVNDEATRLTLGVFGSSLLKAAPVCIAIALLTFLRSPVWNLAREIELHTEWGVGAAACALRPADTLVIQPVATGQSQPADFCRDVLRQRRNEAEKQTDRRRADQRFDRLNRAEAILTDLFSKS